ncbi:MAG: ATP synthase F1 subunit delta [Bacteroidota bacterium]
MSQVRVARRYAAGLMAAAEEWGTVDETARDMALLARLMEESRELRLLAASPVVGAARKTQAFEAVLGSRVGAGTMTFLRLMAAKGREALLAQVAAQFAALSDIRAGIVEAEVRSAAALEPAQEALLRARLEKETGKTVRLRILLDGSLKGGLVVKIGDTVRDASVRRQLELLRERLTGDAGAGGSRPQAPR